MDRPSKKDKKNTQPVAIVREGLDHINQGISIFDSDLKLVTWNSGMLELLDIPSELAYEGATFESFIRHNAEQGEYGPGNIELLIKERIKAARRFEPHLFERKRPDGTIIEVSGTPLPGGGFVTVYSDITAQKQTEDELQRRVSERTSALRLSQARLQLIANEVPAGIAQIDQDMTILFANKRFSRAYGLSPDEIIGRRCQDVLHDSTMQESYKYFEQARRGAVVDFENRTIMAGNKVRDVRTFLRPDNTSDGKVTGFYILSVDVTGKKAATSALLRSQKMDALGRLSSGISHDFNNLLTIILGNLMPLNEQLGDGNLGEEYLEPAISAAKRGSEMTRRLLNLARRQPINPAPVVANDVIEDLMKLLRNSLPESINLKLDLNRGDKRVFVDVSELETALLNIIVNARDAISDRGEIRISTDIHRLEPGNAELLKIAAGSYLRIRVSDTGHGVGAGETEQIFEPFHTTKGESGGSGLGLAMVYGFVQQSNGAIWVESELDAGATFTILLPITNKLPTQVDPEVEGDTSIAGDGTQMILLVEDDAEVRRVVRRQLVTMGFATLEAETADNAMELIEVVEDVEMVLSDVTMPGELDGCDFARALKIKRPHLPVVLMSGQFDANEAPTKLPAGVPLIRKPFVQGELVNAFAQARANAKQETMAGTP